jgi:DNA mismatch endonuclease (patch repair protein)
MADRVSKEVRSRIMSRIKGQNTKPELLVFGELRRRRIYFRKHYKSAPGRPDVAVPGFKIAVFIDGDFWHGWRFPQWEHKLPSAYWREKITKNRARDRRNFARLRRQGWAVLRVWEHQLRRDPETTIAGIANFIRERRAAYLKGHGRPCNRPFNRTRK